MVGTKKSHLSHDSKITTVAYEQELNQAEETCLS